MYVIKMGLEEFENWEQNVSYIVKKISKQEIRNLLMSFFEMNEVPEILAVSREKISINAFTLLKKKLFKFEITFLPNNNKTEMILRLKYGKTKIECTEKIEIAEKNDCLEIYLSETKQYLFSIYF